MDGKKIFALAMVGLILYFLFTDPTGSADAAQKALGWLGDGPAAVVVTFIQNLFRGA